MTLTKEEIQSIIEANKMLIELIAQNEQKEVWNRFRKNVENWPGGKLESMVNA